MTAFDRVERQLPELLDDLAAARVPDYLDDMLQRASQTRQRPAWSAPERWLPMGVIARPVPTPGVPWRLIALVAMLAILATATFVYVGSRPDKVPSPFGVAKNGTLLIGTAEGDIVSVDPATGVTAPLLSGPIRDEGPFFSPDGRQFVFDRLAALWIANADGSAARELIPAEAGLVWFEWSPRGDAVLAVQDIDGNGSISMIDLASGKWTPMELDQDVLAASWRPNHEELIVTAAEGDNVSFWVVGTDGTGARQIAASTYAVNEPTLSPDGSTLAYATWEPGIEGRIRAVDIDADRDRALTSDDNDGYVWQDPQFSPDGTQLLLRRFTAQTTPITAQVAVLDIDAGTTVEFGPENPNPQPSLQFSPDGETIVVTYASGETWLYDSNGSNERQAPFKGSGGLSWQRDALD